MLYEVANAIKAMIASSFNVVEFYDGQFEKFDEVPVNPPHAYVDISGGRSGVVGVGTAEIDVKIYIMTSSMAHNPNNMLMKLESVIAALHNKPIRYDVGTAVNTPPSVYAGRCFCGEYKSLVTYPGLSVWELSATVKISEVL